MKKIGTKKALGIVTYNRPDYIKEILETTRYNEVDKVFLIDASGTNEGFPLTDSVLTLLSNNIPLTVGQAKNRLLRAMEECDIDHMFLQEDDVAIQKDGVFDHYIETAKQSGIWGGLNYAWHGHGNKDATGMPQIKNEFDLDDGLGVITTHNQTAAFSYFHRGIIKKMGMFDEFYQNCWEHMDHYQKLSSNKLTSFWWHFPDARSSEDFIRDLDDGKHGGSVIRKDAQWQENMKLGQEHFKDKYGFTPTGMPVASDAQVEERFQYLVDNYSI